MKKHYEHKFKDEKCCRDEKFRDHVKERAYTEGKLRL
jgi:hypothetical protein